MGRSGAEARVLAIPQLLAALDTPLVAPVLHHKAVRHKGRVQCQVKVKISAVGMKFVVHIVPSQLIGSVEVDSLFLREGGPSFRTAGNL